MGNKCRKSKTIFTRFSVMTSLIYWIFPRNTLYLPNFCGEYSYLLDFPRNTLYLPDFPEEYTVCQTGITNYSTENLN